MLGLGVLLLVLSAIVSLVGSVMFAVAAFRVSVVWGLLVLFVPFAALFFVIKYWAQAKRGFLVGLAGSALALIGFLAFGAGVAAKAQGQPGAIASQMKSELERQQKASFHAPAGMETPAAPVEPTTAPAPSIPSSGGRVPALQARTPRALADIPLDAGDPREIRPKDFARHVGEDLLFVDKDGDSVWGRLVSVGPRALKIERHLHGGSVQYDLPLADVRTVRTDS
jgi:hypothetical protein